MAVASSQKSTPDYTLTAVLKGKQLLLCYKELSNVSPYVSAHIVLSSEK